MILHLEYNVEVELESGDDSVPNDLRLESIKNAVLDVITEALNEITITDPEILSDMPQFYVSIADEAK